MWIGTAAQCRELDRVAIEENYCTSLGLMEIAGEIVVDAILHSGLDTDRCVVFCGTGNNGGDGFVIARLLQDRGFEVTAVLAGDEARMSPDCLTNFNLWEEAGGQTFPFEINRLEVIEAELSRADLAVDALLGTGQEGELRGEIRDACVLLANANCPVVSVDIPTGINADTGESLGTHVHAALTVSFEMAKLGFFQNDGVEATGDWLVESLGIPPKVYPEKPDAVVLDELAVGEMLGIRPLSSHKGANGHVLIVAGSFRMRGAAVLAAEGALRAGAGLVTVAGISEVMDAVAASVPEALLLPLEDTDGVLGPESVSDLLDQQDRYDCAVFGPGLTTHEKTRSFLQEVWKSWETPSVVDADALNALSLGLELPAGPCVLTPHPGEMARLLGMGSERVQADRFGAVMRAAAKYGHVVILKGAYTLTAAPGSAVVVNPTGNPGMASGGMGDVLAGVIGSLIGQGLDPMQASVCGTFLHGLAGDLAAQSGGEIGLIASDVCGTIPSARAKLEGCEPTE